MKDSIKMIFQIDEVCDAAGISKEALMAIVENGIVDPEIEEQSLFFRVETLAVIKKASRLKYDLEIDWPGVAVAMDILAELEEVRAENQLLKQRLQRFLQH